MDVEKRLKQLESKEQTGKHEDSDQEEKEESDDDDARKSIDGDISEEEEMDEEMDGGTDYANNYFDNGEAYEDGEDDNLEDGDVYWAVILFLFVLCFLPIHFFITYYLL